jgi:predicted metal-dependent hydrolase
MTEQEIQELIQAVYQLCATTPMHFTEIINAATHGVKKFAEIQSDIATPLAGMVFSMLLTYKRTNEKCPFEEKQMLDHVAPWFKGTQGFEEKLKEIEGNAQREQLRKTTKIKLDARKSQ